LVGRLVDIRTHENLTDKRIAELSRVEFSTLPLERAIVTVKGSGARKLAVFSDPDCPYCKQLERELDGVGDVTIYTFLFPLTSIHPDAERKARLVWCAPDRARAWSELMLLGREPENVATCSSPIAENLRLGEKLSIEGTPGIVFASGRLVPGVIGREQIERYLAERSLPSG
jgi:thiol:disulfide interchange protein DsbC